MAGFALERVDDATTQRNFDRILAALGVIAQIPVFVGTGSPNGQIEASPPAVYFNLAGGAATTLYVKETGSVTNTGWVGK